MLSSTPRGKGLVRLTDRYEKAYYQAAYPRRRVATRVHTR